MTVGQAHRPPVATYSRQFVISRHAIERFRERVDVEFNARNDDDLGNLLDERIRYAEERETVTDLHNIDTPTIVARIENRDGKPLFAVVRENTCITVLDEEMVTRKFEQGTWRRGPMNAAFRPVLRGAVVPTLAPTVQLRPLETAEPPHALEESLAIASAVTETVPRIAPAPIALPTLAPIEQAGIDYARALVRKQTAHIALINARTAVLDAERDHNSASADVEQAQATIMSLAEKGIT